jgi:hypothetical protein
VLHLDELEIDGGRASHRHHAPDPLSVVCVCVCVCVCVFVCLCVCVCVWKPWIKCKKSIIETNTQFSKKVSRGGVGGEESGWLFHHRCVAAVVAWPLSCPPSHPSPAGLRLCFTSRRKPPRWFVVKSFPPNGISWRVATFCRVCGPLVRILGGANGCAWR